MKHLTNRALSILLAMVMCLSMAVPAMATEEPVVDAPVVDVPPPPEGKAAEDGDAVVLATDTTGLDAALAGAKPILDKGDYGWTPETWRAFDNAYTVAYDAIDAAEADKIAAAEGLKTAQTALKSYLAVELESEGWVRVRGGLDSLESGETYMIHSNNAANRILYNNAGNLLTDQLTGAPTGDILAPNSGFDLSRQTWVIEEVTGGWTVKSVDSGYYLNPSAATSSKIDMSTEPVVLQIAEGTTDTDGFTIIGANGYAVSASSGTFYCSTDAAELGLYVYSTYKIPAPTEYYDDGAPADGTVPDNDTVSGNVSNPFPYGLAGSNYFRIPAIITLQNQSDPDKNGRVVAAIDARYNHTADAGGLDTIVSYSDDGGVNWNYTFANYFDDSTNAYSGYGTALIDPVLVEDKNGTIHMMVDAFPGGIALNTVDGRPGYTTGYVAIGDDGDADADGIQRLVLYTHYNDQTDDNWDYYVGDFDEGYAPVYTRGKTADPDYYIDEYFGLYAVDSNGAKQKMYCNRLGNSTQYVQQNAFYYNAHLHVRNATYLWIVTSTDGGETWSAPYIINDQIRTGEHWFLGVGPGAGLLLEDGTIVFPVYVNPNEWSCFIYSSDNGKTWKRSDYCITDNKSSESFLIQINSTTLRQFYRDMTPVLRYTDHTWDGTKWVAGECVATEAVKTTNNQISGILYSKTVNGKPAILVSTAATGTGTRSYGRIYTLVVNDDLTMSLAATYDVTGPNDAYSYSSITELEDGTVALLYESAGGYVTYKTFTIDDLIAGDGAFVEGGSTTTALTIDQYKVTKKAYDFITGASIPTDEYVKVEVDDGVVSFTGLKAGSTTLTLDGYTFEITVNAFDEDAVIDLYVEKDETKSWHLTSNVVSMGADSAIATAAVTETGSITVTGGQGNLGGDASYIGAATPLANALWQFNGSVDEGFTVSHTNEDGSVAYLNLLVERFWPTATTPGNSPVFVTESTAVDGTFYLDSTGSDGTTNRLSFRDWDSTFPFFDNPPATSVGGNEADLFLYRPAESGEASSAEISGYVQVKSLDEIEDGGFYLIVFDSEYATDPVSIVDGNAYALYPLPRASYWSSTIKLNPSLANATGTAYSTPRFVLNVTGSAVGTTYMTLGDQIYRINVVEEMLTREITITGSLDKIWDGTAVDVTDLTIGIDPAPDASLVTYAYHDSNGKRLGAAPSAVGTYTLTITVAEADGYLGATVDVEFTISAIEITFGEETTGGVGTARTVTADATFDGNQYMVVQITEGSGESAVVNLVMVQLTGEDPTVTISYQSTASVEVFITSGGLPNLTGSGDMGAVVIGSATAN